MCFNVVAKSHVELNTSIFEAAYAGETQSGGIFQVINVTASHKRLL